ncbi:unnamed protein product, partial [Prorocentrum cordatum]
MTVTPCEEGKVSLPDDVRDARYADVTGGTRARDLLDRFIERNRPSPGEVGELDQKFGAVKPCLDRRLESSPRLYRRLFKPPPGAQLCTAEGLGRIELQAGADDVCLAQADVADCFHRLRMREELAEYFALPPPPARAAGLLGRARGWKGFSWSLVVAQCVNECHAAQGPGLELQPSAADRRGPAVLGAEEPTAHCVCVDNLDVLDADRSRGVAGCAGACARPLGRGRWSWTDEASRLDAEKRKSRLAATRSWRLNAGLRWLLARRKVSTHQVEVF